MKSYLLILAVFSVLIIGCSTNKLSKKELILQNKALKDSINSIHANFNYDSIQPNISLTGIPKVVYRGLPNTINVNYPGAKKIAIEASSCKLKKIDEWGSYSFTPTKWRKVIFKANIKTLNNTYKTITEEFKIIDIERPKGYINGDAGIVFITKIKDLRML